MYVVCMTIGTGSVANAYEWMKLYILIREWKKFGLALYVAWLDKLIILW